MALRNSMAEFYGNYEICMTFAFVRLKIEDDDYHYIVSQDIFGSKDLALKACKVFQDGYRCSKQETSKILRGIMDP